MGVDDFCDYLEEKGFHSDIVTSFHRNRMSGATFLELSKDDLKDMGARDRRQSDRLQTSGRITRGTVSHC